MSLIDTAIALGAGFIDFVATHFSPELCLYFLVGMAIGSLPGLTSPGDADKRKRRP